ncbi:putative colanic acid biosynthesis acetyltransferase [Oryzifoliimicrobium ureilyticus]|uniref:putative colanic acid biosynthesis acetyltransferase n=1 Tax=Oryzifoliimicrobium ureilyticus TaxID=3113724 RepID=UPI003F675960
MPLAILDAKFTNPKEGGPSFSLGHRLSRLLWNVCWTTLGIWTPTPMFAWRRILLRSFGANVSSKAKVYPFVRIWYPRNLTMQDYSCLARGFNCYCVDHIQLGTYALVSQNAFLCGGTHDVDDVHFQLMTKPIVIGADAWVAAEAFVGPGVVIGHSAVLGARAVVFKNLEPHTIYAGNPAIALRRRKQNEAENG